LRSLLISDAALKTATQDAFHVIVSQKHVCETQRHRTLGARGFFRGEATAYNRNFATKTVTKDGY